METTLVFQIFSVQALDFCLSDRCILMGMGTEANIYGPGTQDVVVRKEILKKCGKIKKIC